MQNFGNNKKWSILDFVVPLSEALKNSYVDIILVTYTTHIFFSIIFQSKKGPENCMFPIFSLHYILAFGINEQILTVVIENSSTALILVYFVLSISDLLVFIVVTSNYYIYCFVANVVKINMVLCLLIGTSLH